MTDAGVGVVVLDPEQEIRRDEHRLDADRQPLVERVLVLLRLVHERDELLDLRGRERAGGTRGRRGRS